MGNKRKTERACLIRPKEKMKKQREVLRKCVIVANAVFTQQRIVGRVTIA